MATWLEKSRSPEYSPAKLSQSLAETNITIDSITQRVSSTEGNITTINGIVAAHNTRIESAESKITPTAIVSTVTNSSEWVSLGSHVSDVDTMVSDVIDVTIPSLQNRVSNTESSITQHADLIASKVSQTDFTGETIVSLIEQTPSQIKISANKIKLEGLVTANSNFKILADGSIEAKNATISGTVIASNGTVGDWSIGSSIYSKHGSTYTTLKGSGLVAFATGAPDPNTTTGSNLQIFHDGRIRKSLDGTQRMLIDNDRINFYDSSGAYAGSITGEFAGYLGINAGSRILCNQNTWVKGWLQPASNSEFDLGSANYRWRTIYLQNNPNVASDIRLKSSIQHIPNELLAELKEIKPKMYQQGEKWHFGYIAQDVERALYRYALKTVGWDKAKDYVREFDVLYKDESYLSLIYAEIAVLKEAEMQARIDELEARLLALEQAC